MATPSGQAPAGPSVDDAPPSDLHNETARFHVTCVWAGRTASRLKPSAGRVTSTPEGTLAPWIIAGPPIAVRLAWSSRPGLARTSDRKFREAARRAFMAEFALSGTTGPRPRWLGYRNGPAAVACRSRAPSRRDAGARFVGSRADEFRGTRRGARRPRVSIRRRCSARDAVGAARDRQDTPRRLLDRIRRGSGNRPGCVL